LSTSALGARLGRAAAVRGRRRARYRIERNTAARYATKVKQLVAAIPEQDWQTIPYTPGSDAQIAETTYGTRRLIVRRTRLIGPQAELWPNWRHVGFVTSRTEDITIVETGHRDHAVVEQVIADLKDQALAHFPSGHFHANGTWTVLAAIAHTASLDAATRPPRRARPRRPHPAPPTAADPRPTDLHARGWTLHLPARWPWHGDYITAINTTRALPAAA
jgi:hypothetical protein